MQTTIKASKQSKKRLERLRDEVARHTGRRVSQRELVDHLIERAAKDPASTAVSLASEGQSMGPMEFREFLKRRSSWGVDDASKDIDAWLYGDGQ